MTNIFSSLNDDENNFLLVMELVLESETSLYMYNSENSILWIEEYLVSILCHLNMVTIIQNFYSRRVLPRWKNTGQ